MFDMSVLWVWIVIYIICLILWVLLHEREGFFLYLLKMTGVSGCVLTPIVVGGILGEEYNSIWAMIPVIIMLCLFIATTRDNFDEFFSKQTIINFLKIVLAVAFFGLLVLSLYLRGNEGEAFEIISIILAAISIFGLIWSLSIINED